MLDPTSTIRKIIKGSIREPLEVSARKKTLTVCMVVRDEARNIREAIQNIQNFADEIVVVDTGSTDETLPILRELPVTLIEEEWKEDFAQARNKGLEAATSAWILWMDADDRVEPKNFSTIRSFVTAPTDRVFVFELINAPLHVHLGESFYQVRLFPNHPKIRFKGRIHEDLGHAVEELGLHSAYVNARIHHMGYSTDEERQRKSKRNLDILAHIPEEERTALTIAREGDAHAMAKDWEAAIRCYESAYEFPHCASEHPALYQHLPVFIGRIYQSAGDLEQALKWFQRSILSYENKLDAYCYAAEIHLELEEEEMAEEAWQFVLKSPKRFDVVGNQDELIRMFSYNGLCELYTKAGRWQDLRTLATGFFSEYAQLVEPCWHLGRALFELESYEEATRILERGMSMYPRPDHAVWQCLFHAYEKLGDREKMQQVKQRYETLSGTSFVPDTAS